MGRRLYVGNLAWTVTDQDLQDAFSEAGDVESSQVIMDRATNRSRGFGFVEMATDEAAEAAIKALESFAGGALEFELAGIKALRAFDANIVIVALGLKKGEGPQRLLGAYLAENDPVRAAVVAVLNATNRLLGNFIATR